MTNKLFCSTTNVAVVPETSSSMTNCYVQTGDPLPYHHVECNHHYVVDVKSGIIISYCDRCGQIKMQTPVSWGQPSCIEPSTEQNPFEHLPTTISPPQDLPNTITTTDFWDYWYNESVGKKVSMGKKENNELTKL